MSPQNTSPSPKPPRRKRHWKIENLVRDADGLIRASYQHRFRNPGAHLSELTKVGALVRLRSGIYFPAREWQTLPPYKQFRLRALAYSLVNNPNLDTSRHDPSYAGPIVTAAGALAIHDSWFITKGARIVLLGKGRRRPAHIPCEFVRSTIAEIDVVEGGGRRLAKLARAAFDEARLRDFRVALVAVDGSLRNGATIAELQALVKQNAGKKGISQFRRALAVSTGRADSPGEVLMKNEVLALGLSYGTQGAKIGRQLAVLSEQTAVTLNFARLHYFEQVDIYAPSSHGDAPTLVGRLDAFIPELAKGLEFDGQVKYTRGGIARTSEGQRTLLEKEIQRERELRAVGVDLTCVTWQQLFDGHWRSTFHSELIQRGVQVSRGSVQFNGSAMLPGMRTLRSSRDAYRKLSGDSPS